MYKEILSMRNFAVCVCPQEYAEGGDLYEALKQAPDGKFSEAVAVADYLAPFLDAVAYLHTQVSKPLSWFIQLISCMPSMVLSF